MGPLFNDINVTLAFGECSSSRRGVIEQISNVISNMKADKLIVNTVN